MQRDDHDELDRILNGALATYSVRQPWPGIEQRVLGRIPQPGSCDAWMRRAVWVPVLTALVVVVAYWVSAATPRAIVPQRSAQIKPDVRHVQAAPATTAAKQVRRVVGRVRRIRPKAPIFPTPSPLTAEERALLRIAVSDPLILQAAVDFQRQSSQPLTVEPINIPPLANGNSMED
jgi:hypothetical protein